jgi:hypothetical protein
MLPDWQVVENRLYELSKAGILRFATEHPEITCSFFAYSANPVYGEFHLCFDTPQNALARAQHNEQKAIKWRNHLLEREGVWQHTHGRLTTPRIIDYSPDPGVFAYPDFEELLFEDLHEIGFDPEYPVSQDYEDDYANGNGALVIWKVLERLIENGVFAALHLASPFRVGYKLHDDPELVVLRILNWPQPQG